MVISVHQIFLFLFVFDASLFFFSFFLCIEFNFAGNSNTKKHTDAIERITVVDIVKQMEATRKEISVAIDQTDSKTVSQQAKRLCNQYESLISEAKHPRYPDLHPLLQTVFRNAIEKLAVIVQQIEKSAQQFMKNPDDADVLQSYEDHNQHAIKYSDDIINVFQPHPSDLHLRIQIDFVNKGLRKNPHDPVLK